MPQPIQLSTCRIGTAEPPFIVAEVGSNFGNYEQSVKLIDLALKAGASAVKFQTYKAETIAHPDAMFTLEDGSQISQYEFFKRYELPESLHYELKAYCDQKGIIFFSTPSHYTDVDFLEKVGIEIYKTGSDDLTNTPFLKYVAATGKPMLVSTGMCTLSEIGEAVEAIFSTGNRNLVLLHCVVGYPAHEDEANIRVIKTLQKAFDVFVGFSDHFQSLVPAVLAASLGATVFEKHITLDRSVGGSDNDVAVELDVFTEYVCQVRSVSSVLGKTFKEITPGEQKWRKAARKSLVAIRDIKKGDTFDRNNLDILRPSGGIHPRYFGLFLGAKARRDIKAHELLQWSDIHD
ncbi:N,N'-diacetyllegionaminic acid synthase [subsurface metagenome]